MLMKTLQKILAILIQAVRTKEKNKKVAKTHARW